mgnify:FL=1
MSWWDELVDWWADEEEEQPAYNPQQMYMEEWRRAAVPNAPKPPVATRDPFEAAVKQWNMPDEEAQREALRKQQTQPNRVAMPLAPGPTAKPMIGPEPPPAPTAPATNPWQAAVDAWQQGPPQGSGWTNREFTQPKPPVDISSLITYDVPGQQPLDLTVERPDTGPTSIQQTQQGLTDTLTMRPPAPMQGPEPLPENAWGVTRWGGNQQAAINPFVPAQAAQSAYDALPGQGFWDKAGNLTRLGMEYLNQPNQDGYTLMDYAPNGKDATDFIRKAAEVGPVDATLSTLFEGTPGYEYALQTYKDRQAEGSNEGFDRFFDNLYTSMAALDAPNKYIQTQQVPGSGQLVKAITGHGGDVSIGQLASAFGEALNKTFNPFNPNSAIETSPDDGLTNPFAVGWDIFQNNLAQSQIVRQTIEALPPEARDMANVGFVNIISGPERLEKTVDSILSQDTMVAEYERLAQEAMAKGDTLAAADYGRRADELSKKTKTQLIDEQINPWAEIMGGILLDPTTFITGAGEEALQAAKTARMMRLTPDQAVKEIAQAMAGDTNPNTWQNVPLVGTLVGDKATTWWNAVNPFARTADTQAHLATDTLFRTATQLLADITEKGQARAIIDVWTQDPSQLVKGIMLQGAEAIADSDGLVKFGPGLMANPELLQQYPVLLGVRDRLLNMRSLTGDGPVNPMELFAELNDTLYKGSREIMGLKPLGDLPSGAASFRVVGTSDGMSAIEYLDKSGKVISQSAEMLPYDAQLAAKNLRNAAKATGGAGVGEKLANAWGIQKAILSDMYLGMSPGYWVKNALSATATLLTDNTYTLLPTRAIMNDFMTKFGGAAPTTRAMDAAGNVIGGLAGESLGTSGAHWTERLFGGAFEGNPYAKLMERLYKIPFGATDIGGAVPFGEQNFALRATYVPFKRYLTQNWKQTATEFGNTLVDMGIDPTIAKGLVAAVADGGINGNKRQLTTAIKQMVGQNAIPFNLSELGVPDELISAEGWAAINRIFQEALPDQIDEAAVEVRRIFGDEFRQAGELLNSAPPQPGRYVWTEAEAVQDGADVVDTLVDAAKRAGMNPDQVKSQAEQMMQQALQAEQQLWGAFRQQLAEFDNPDGLNVAMGLLGKWYDWRRAARQQVDDLSRQAIEANTPEAWARKFEGTQQIYGGFTEFFTGAVQEARENLLKLSQGQEVPASYDWMDVIKRYASYDEAAINQARTLAVGSVQDAGSAFEAVIDANRQYIDKSFVELFSAFRRYPTQQGLDLLADGAKKVEALGAQAAAYLAGKRAEMLPERASDYFDLRNQVWAQMFDNGVVMNNAVKRLIVAQGLAEQAKTGLQWADEFAGGTFQLVGKLSDTMWQALNKDTGELVRFADPVNIANKAVAVSSLPQVPPNIIQDFYRLIGESTNMVDTLIREIDAEAAAKRAAQEVNVVAKQGPELVDTAPPLTMGPPSPEWAKGQQAAMAAADKSIVGLAKEEGVSAQEIEQTLTTFLEQSFADNPVAYQIESGYIDQLLDSGRLKTQFETGTSASTVDTSMRRRNELAVLNVANDTPDVERPVYGYLRMNRGEEEWIDAYGEITFLLKDDVKQRATFTVGDSIDSFGDVAAAPITAPAKEAIGPHTDALYRMAVSKQYGFDEELMPYIETQIRGGVGLADIATVLDPTGALTPAQVKRFADQGIQVVQGVATEAATTPATTAAATTVLRELPDRVADALNQLPQGKRYRLSDLSKQFTDEEWPAVQRQLRELQLEGKLVLMPIDDPKTIKQLDIDKAIHVGDDTRMIVYVKEPISVKALQAPGAPTMGAGLVDFGSLIQRGQEIASMFGRGADGFNPFGLVPGKDDVHQVVQGLHENLYQLMGNKAPEIGEMALHQIDTLRQAEQQILRRLPELLAGKPNTLTTAQQLAVIDAVQKLLPQYDNVLAGAVRVGEQMGNFAMLNYNDRRNLDTWLGMIMPYHYFWSRSAKNWMQRSATKPGVVNFWFESEEAIRQENQQNNMPVHLQGTIQNPLPVGPDRLGNPLTYALPFAMYLGSDFVNPDEARSEAERWLMMVQKFTPAMYPVVDYARKVMLDQSAPLPGGKKRTDDWQLGDIIPAYRMGGYAYQAFTGQMGPQGPLAFGDEYDYGRAGKQTALQAISGDLDPKDAAWGLDVGYQRQQGLGPLPEQPPGAAAAWEQGAQRAGWERLANRAMSYFFGVPGYYLGDAEQEMRETKGTRVGLGYNEVTNPWGSRAAVNEYTGTEGELYDAAFNYGTLYPQSDTRKRTRPGEAAAQAEYYDKYAVIMEEMNAEVAAYLLDNPEATTKQITDLKSPYWDRTKALQDEYPSLPDSDKNKGLNTKYMNPAEHAQAWVEKAISYKPKGKPKYPGKDASAEEKKEYYLAKAKWDEKRLDHIDNTFSQFLLYNDEFPDPWKEQAKKMVQQMYASELLRKYENRYASDVEKAWNTRQVFVEEVEDAEWKNREKQVVDRVGQEGYDLLQQYYALPKGSEERSQFKEANPLVQQAIMASYQPAEYDQFIERFGANAFGMLAERPTYPGDGASEAQLQQYYAKLNAYNRKYPNAEAVKLWLNGRRFGGAEGSDSYGAAYDEAIAIFGPNIFDILNSFPSGGSKDQVSAWYKAHPEWGTLRTGYLEWKKEYQDQDRATMGQSGGDKADVTASNVDAGEGYTGPRPVGSDRQPIGSFDPLSDAPNQWTNYSWDSLLNQPAANPWTQRANELNAALLGDESIPSEMNIPPGYPTVTRADDGAVTIGTADPTPTGTGAAPTGKRKTAKEYAMMSESYAKGEMSRKEWEDRRGWVERRWGKEGAEMWDAYYALPKGSEARKQYIRDNPNMRIINLYAYNREKVEEAMTELGIDAAFGWANVPPYADTEEAKAARAAYYDKNPKAFLFGAWLNGRPANYDESKEGSDDFKYNWGADYKEAKALFGDNIWDIVSQFKREWNSTQRRMFYEKFPQYNEWADWWYGREKKEYSRSGSSGRGGGGGGGGGGGFFGGYNEAEPRFQANIQNVYGREMARGLADEPRMGGFNPARIDRDWMYAGKDLRPDQQRIRQWSPGWIRGIK